MKKESEFKKKTVICELLGHKAEIAVSSKTSVLCEKIKNEARALLKELEEEPQGDCENARIAKFFKKSIKALGGEKLFFEAFAEKEASVAELSGVLCCIISALGEALAEDTEA